MNLWSTVSASRVLFFFIVNYIKILKFINHQANSVASTRNIPTRRFPTGPQRYSSPRKKHENRCGIWEIWWGISRAMTTLDHFNIFSPQRQQTSSTPWHCAQRGSRTARGMYGPVSCLQKALFFTINHWDDPLLVLHSKRFRSLKFLYKSWCFFFSPSCGRHVRWTTISLDNG